MSSSSNRLVRSVSTVRAKVAALVLGATLVSCLSVGVVSYQIGKAGLIDASEMRLASIAATQSDGLERFSARIDQSLAELSQNTAIGDAADAVVNYLKIERPQILAAFQDTAKTPEQRAAFDGNGTKLLYGVQHAGIHGTLSSAWRNSGVSDIYVVDKSGIIIYSVTKGPEFASNVADPGNESLKTMVDQIMAGPTDKTYSSGFVSFSSEDSKTSAFVGRALAVSKWGNVEVKGAILFRVAPAKLAPVVIPDAANSDAAYLIAADGTVRAGTTAAAGVPQDLLALAKAPQTGANFATSGDSRLFYSYVPVSLFGQQNLLAIGQEEAKVLAPANELAFWATLATIAILLGMGLVGLLVSASLTRPLTVLANLMNRLNDGDKSIEITSANRKDEIGTMARALVSFRNNALEKERMEVASRERDEQLDLERQDREAEKARTAQELEQAISALAGALKRLSRGELNIAIDRPFAGSLDQLRVDFNDSVEQLEATMRSLTTSIDTIRAGSSDLRGASENLAHRTERQAASLEEAAAALAEMSGAVTETLQQCDMAVDVAASALTSAQSSTTVVQDAIVAMQRLEDSSAKIRQIIDVIDQIAFQTNLLALNAGVEAARAGEAGKGFAVVAQEVRELAQKSAGAARDINALIATSAADVENGVTLVLKTGDSLTMIQRSISSINETIGVIAGSSREQSGRLREISASVNELDQMTQQNAAMVEETTAAVFSLSHETDELGARISHFTLSPDHRRLHAA
ncbi:methyl-accepting chemotaxis protein [Rhizobium sp. SSA_523]|uniref:methyl-accepting chemotaxis protein n=1 Tax=Rhizobium sp. SSA_523 TaxID=2952477 RepID=UPI002090C9B1|nr:methyl-accepting chemotaxis protein [Rhizobium sp. SSA_523]MCO5730408.1 methyl-accepting chemotaxis protein [Rhizobium sp. SSA_523]WKC25452.1 methyl-accepting chemotaxis protein [Rhizobium sp. SSA_523]